MKHLSRILAIGLTLPALAGCRSITRTDESWAALADPHRHDLDVGGVSLHYVELGQGEPVVMIHGIGDSTYSWHENAPTLAEAGLRLILVDQPGFGNSSIPQKGWIYSIENQGEAILRLVDRLGIDKFAIVGHSLGGGVSLYLAWKHPERITRIAVLSPVSQRTSCPFGVSTDILTTVVGTRWLIERALRSAFHDSDKVSDTVIDEYARLIDRPGRAGRGVLGGVCRDYFSPTYDRMVESYESLAPRMLIIWGADDTWHPLSFGTTLHSRVRGSRLETIAGAGHNVHQERADVVNALLQGFLTEAPSEPRSERALAPPEPDPAPGASTTGGAKP